MERLVGPTQKTGHSAGAATHAPAVREKCNKLTGRVRESGGPDVRTCECQLKQSEEHRVDAVGRRKRGGGCVQEVELRSQTSIRKDGTRW